MIDKFDGRTAGAFSDAFDCSVSILGYDGNNVHDIVDEYAIRKGLQNESFWFKSKEFLKAMLIRDMYLTSDGGALVFYEARKIMDDVLSMNVVDESMIDDVDQYIVDHNLVDCNLSVVYGSLVLSSVVKSRNSFVDMFIVLLFALLFVNMSFILMLIIG